MALNGEPLIPVVLSSVNQHSWIGYYTTNALGFFKHLEPDTGSGHVPDESEHTLELKLSRFVGGGLHEDWDFTNYTGRDVEFDFTLSVDCDFADYAELFGKRLQHGHMAVIHRREDVDHILDFRYQAEHAYRKQGNDGVARIDRGLCLRLHNFHNSSVNPAYKEEKRTFHFHIQLRPFETCHFCISMTARIEDTLLAPQYGCSSFEPADEVRDQSRIRYLREATNLYDLYDPNKASFLSPTVFATVEQARRDLASLRLDDEDNNDDVWTVAAGWPMYTAVYGRDVLTTGWQAALLGPEMMKGAAKILAQTQGREINDWYDEEPGRMIHEMHSGPLAALKYTPQARNYGAVTTSHCYPLLLSQLWHWTGQRESVEPYLEAALKALKWTDTYGDRDGDGFYSYKTHSEQGTVHQGWKDSEYAIVDENGDYVRPPIAICEEQGFVYASKYMFSELLWSLGRKEEARALIKQARELKARFNETFWDEDLGYFAMGLGPKGERIRAIASNPGHCLTTGIVEDALVSRVVNRLFADDLFSGWGVRTLSSANPAYNPYSYHRGSVWPVETGTFVFGLIRFGLHEYAHKLARAFFEAAGLFEHCRLPEVISGHPRDREHPIPAIYSQANSPQAWSASAVFLVLQALLGIYPYAPLKVLFVDPQLPDWLPKIELNGLRVGDSVLHLQFFRREDGRSDYRLMDQIGDVHVVRQPNPWSLTATWSERLRDGVQTLLR